MKLLSLTCSHCAAPLEVPENAKFVTCSYCSARLAVHQSGGAAYTEVLEALEQRAEKIAEDVESLKLQSELDRIDREWMLERERYMLHDKHGRRHYPSKVGGSIMMVFVIGFAIFWMFMARETTVVLFGFVFIAVAVVMFLVNLSKADQYERRRQQYERRRSQILRRIESRLP